MITDAFELLCHFAEASDDFFRASALDYVAEPALQLLQRLGAVEEGPQPTTVTCSECDGDHPALIEFDDVRHCYFHRCPEAGTVKVPNTDLASFLFRPEWLVNWLAQELRVVPRVKRNTPVANDVWHVGDARCGDTLATIIFARRLFAHADLDRLASALRSIHRADSGVVVTTSVHAARQIGWPGGYELLLLPEIARAGPAGLALNFERFGQWLQSIKPTTAKGGATKVGRPTPRARIAQIFESHHKSGVICDTIAGEAKAILAEWQQHFPDQRKPGSSTTRDHVARLMRANSHL